MGGLTDEHTHLESPEQLLARARAAGLAVKREGSSLIVRGPRQAEAIALKVLDQKSEILRALDDLSGSLTAPPAKSEATAFCWLGALADWALLLSPEDLPSQFRLGPGVEVVHRERFLHSIKADVLAGPGGPRALYGGIQSDLRRLRSVLLGEGNKDLPARFNQDTGEHG